MSQVYIALDDPKTRTWGLYRVGTGPFRCVENGLRSVPEAKRFANKCGHEVVTLTALPPR